MSKYDFQKIEKRWQAQWLKDGIYEPSFAQGDNSTLRRAQGKKAAPFYNLMMFPYPSAEGLHVGNMYAFVGSDIYGRVKRMQGSDIFQPIGLDGFGIHSENYALKVKKHPAEQAKISEKNFYRQLQEIGNGFAWNEKLETYDPEYYKWTQWIFTAMFKHGLAYRKKQVVNWCPSCKTVLADEQVAGGECERCDTKVVKKELEQWFFRITKYAEQLLKNLEKLDWSEKIKVAQRNWIGKSEGAELDFEVRTTQKPNFVLLHGYTGSPRTNFLPWLKKELEGRGYTVQAPALPHSDKARASEKEDMDVFRRDVKLDKNTVIVGHSLGTIVAMKAVQELSHSVRKLVLVGGFLEPRFRDHDRSFAKTFDWNFDFKKIRNNAEQIVILHDVDDTVIPYDQGEKLRDALSGELVEPKPFESHFTAEMEPSVLRYALDTIPVFTTRPDTLFGATYMVLAPEHPIIEDLGFRIENLGEVKSYIKKAKAKSEQERIANGKEKTGVELRGVKVINPGTKREIPVWVADYVVMGYGTGAIMAVPAHDERDAEFAEIFGLPASDAPLVDGEKVIRDVGGIKKIQYRLRDWLISRQRYWGPPIPMIYCETCAKAGRGEQKEMPGWYAVPEKDLPVLLPEVKDFQPKGKDESPLASVKSFYEARCPACGGKARRETDVSDTFLDSAWYYIGYLATSQKPLATSNPFSNSLIQKWLPARMYIGGAEHSVLHLLYVRFLALALHDIGLLEFGPSPAPKGEPFPKFRAHGLLIREGKKISKSKNNIVNPDEFIKKFGADALRMHLMFLGPFEEGGDFRDEGILGPVRFLERVWRLIQNAKISTKGGFASGGKNQNDSSKSKNKEIERILHKTIKKVTEDVENLRYNTAVSALMVLLNKFEGNYPLLSTHYSLFLKLLAPFAPHITEEIWRNALGNKNSIHSEPWPSYDERLIQDEKFTLVIQINGKIRDSVEVDADTSENSAKETALQREKIKALLQGKKPKRVIYVRGRLVNIVI